MIAMVDKNGNLIISGPNCIRELPIVVVDYDFDNFYYEQNSYYPRNSYPWMHQNYIVDRGGRPPRPPKSDGKSNISYRPAGEKMSSKPGRAAAVPKRRSSTDNEGHGPRRRGNRR